MEDSKKILKIIFKLEGKNELFTNLKWELEETSDFTRHQTKAAESMTSRIG